MGRSVFYRPPRSGTIQSVQSLMRINQPPRRSAEMHQVFLISVNVGYCQPSISRECWAALRIKSTTFLVAPPNALVVSQRLIPPKYQGRGVTGLSYRKARPKIATCLHPNTLCPGLGRGFFSWHQIGTDQSDARTSAFEVEVSATDGLCSLAIAFAT